ncbi:hypothetical protein K9L27_00175 [Candidatus Gracilibacteria bacterium]|nr:hypothetical protein [Candidatus Gracilibacteria bacterium]
MAGRLLILVVLIGGGILWFSSDLDINADGMWKKTQAFVLEKFGTDLEVQREILMKKKDELTATLQELQATLESKKDEGVDKLTEIQDNINRTQKAFQSTKEALDELQDSLKDGGESLGVIEP